jgi:hypothetical protein
MRHHGILLIISDNVKRSFELIFSGIYEADYVTVAT